MAGDGKQGYSGDGGPATQASLNCPFAVAFAPDGSLHIADTGNHRIRKVDRDGIITTVAGNGAARYAGDGGPAIKASLWEPKGITVGPDGSLSIADTSNCRIREVTAKR